MGTATFGVEGGSGFVLDNANYAQKTYSNTFSPEGIKKYSDLAGEPINTVDDLVNATNNGKISVNDLPIEYIVRDGYANIKYKNVPGIDTGRNTT